MTTALLRGAASDPVLARASSRIGAMLATPPEIFADPAVQQRIGPHLSAPRYPAQAPSRKELLQVLAEARGSLETPALRAS
ncbi:hypothetical protein GCM10010038_22110 [Glutamicibacter protophormiae]|nr:hypothetical protein GCM10010038_22110 [Glutamicibacter protophormiae]